MAADRDERVIRFVEKAGTVSTSQIATKLGVSRQAAHRRLKALAARGAVLQQGDGRGARWVKPDARHVRFEYTVEGLAEDRVYDALERKVPALRALGPEARSVAYYAFTEMLNNVIDHSGSKGVEIAISHDAGGVNFEIRDEGVGVFTNIRSAMKLATPLEALEELHKGKVTTMPERHSGEGVFFSSKATERFELEADGLRWIVDNLREDFAVEEAKTKPGTRVAFRVGSAPHRTLKEVFDLFTDDFDFTKTRTVVRLFGLGVDFVSRSEAKRLVRGLEAFREVTLDFDRVASIGQGFADEVFRVFALAHPATVLVPIRMAATVAFMVRRATQAAAARAT